MKESNRRQFFIDLIRVGAATGLAAVTAVLLSRRRSRKSAFGEDPHTCSNDWICVDCTRIANCILPQALSVKQRELN
jgi:hypothetical protein